MVKKKDWQNDKILNDEESGQTKDHRDILILSCDVLLAPGRCIVRCIVLSVSYTSASIWINPM